MNPKANGQLQHHWGWLIAVYLFLGGVGAGAYTIAALNGLMGKELELSSRVGLWIGFPALLIGSLCLMADLGSPLKAVYAGLKVGTSWIARGFWIISAFMVLSLVHLVLFMQGARLGGENGSLLAVIATLGIIAALGTMAYTGLLLGASKGVPFWRSGMVPMVFVISALVTGHCAIMLGMLLFRASAVTPGALKVMAVEAIFLILIELFAILLYLQSSARMAEAQESTSRILKNKTFVVGYFLLGLGAPLLLMLVLAMQTQSLGIAFVASLLGLLGGLILRWSVLKAGTMPSWHVAGFEFRRTPRPKDTKPRISDAVPPIS